MTVVLDDRVGDAALVIVRDGDKILCASRPEPPYELAIPGGLVDPGETPDVAAIRELKEECGIDVAGVTLVRVIKSPSDGRKVHVFAAISWSGTAVAAEEGTRIDWLNAVELLGQSRLYRETVLDLLTSGAFYGQAPSQAVQDALHQMDLSPADVHVPSAAPLRRARTPMKTKAKKNTTAGVKTGKAPPFPSGKRKGVAVHAHLGPGGRLQVRSMSDLAGGKLLCLPSISMGDDATALADRNAPVWIQVAKCGAFKGHPAGEFELTPQIFDQMVANFLATDNRRIPIDFEHASEAQATDGSVPVTGAPAQGWIIDLKNRGADGLWGLVQWLEPAREYIKQGQYRYFSPAIRFNSRDRVTGKPIGARLTSGGLTNSPFLDGMQPLVARDFDSSPMAANDTGCFSIACGEKGRQSFLVYEDTPSITTLSGKSAYAHQPDEYMPAIRAALSMHPLCSAADCCDKLSDLRDHLDAVDGDATQTHEGVTLSVPCMQLRSLVGARPGDTWDDVFDAVEALIQAAIGDGGEEPSEAAMTAPMDDDPDGGGDDGAAMRAAGGAAAAQDNQPAGGLTAASTRDNMETIQTLTDKLTVLSTEKASLATEKTALLTEKGQLTTDKAELTLKVKDLEGQVTTKDAELVTLRADAVKRAEADLKAKVDAAFETYKVKKNLTDTDRETMTIVAKASPEKFDAAYPPVALSERHLMADLTGKKDGPTGTSVDAAAGEPVTMSLRQLAKQIASKQGISLSDAQRVAEKMIARARKTAA